MGISPLKACLHGTASRTMSRGACASCKQVMLRQTDLPTLEAGTTAAPISRLWRRCHSRGSIGTTLCAIAPTTLVSSLALPAGALHRAVPGPMSLLQDGDTYGLPNRLRIQSGSSYCTYLRPPSQQDDLHMEWAACLGWATMVWYSMRCKVVGHYRWLLT